MYIAALREWYKNVAFQRVQWAPFPPARARWVAWRAIVKTQIFFLFFVYYRSDSKSCHPITALIESHHYSWVCDIVQHNAGPPEIPVSRLKNSPPRSKNIPENSRYWNKYSPSSSQQYFIQLTTLQTCSELMNSHSL